MFRKRDRPFVLSSTSEQSSAYLVCSEHAIRTWPPSSLAARVFPALQSHASDLALVGAKIIFLHPNHLSKAARSSIHNGQILSVGPIAGIEVPRGTTVIDCKGLVVTAGFSNSHVHILLPGLLHAENLSSERITSQLRQMLTRWDSLPSLISLPCSRTRSRPPSHNRGRSEGAADSHRW